MLVMRQASAMGICCIEGIHSATDRSVPKGPQSAASHVLEKHEGRKVRTGIVGAAVQDHDRQQSDPNPHRLQCPEHPEFHCRQSKTFLYCTNNAS